MLTEAKIEKKIVRWCRENGVYTRKFVSPAHRGVPDRIFIKDGRVLFMELKREGNRPTALQNWEMDQLRAAGASVLVGVGHSAALLQLVGFFFVAFPERVDPTDFI